MTKFKANALKKTRKLLQKKNTLYDISSDSDTSVGSEEYSHIPIPDLHLPLEDLTMEPQQNQANPLTRGYKSTTGSHDASHRGHNCQASTI